jgi:isopentenyl-diphosphate delta-isomerase
MEKEQIILVDEIGNQIGTAPKLASHHASTPLHLAFSCYIFDEQGKFLVTQRALSKKVWPGVWTNSVCGHPTPGESFEQAITRRAQDELGMKVKGIQEILPDYRYRTPPYNGIIENEICPVFVARAASDVSPNPEEVESYHWMPWKEYEKELREQPDEYSYWAKDQYKQLIDSDTFVTFEIY